MASIKFEEGVKIIPTSVKTFPIKIIKTGVNSLGVKVIFKSPRKESIKTLREREAVNNVNGGNYRGINKELTWAKGEIGEKTIYVDILKKQIGEPLTFEIELELVSKGTVEMKYCRCILIEDLSVFVNSNIYNSKELLSKDEKDIFDITENKRFRPVFLDENLNEIEDLIADINIKENELETNYINSNLFHMEGNIKGTLMYPEKEVFEELEIEGCYLGLKIPFESLYKKRKTVNIYSEESISGFIKESSDIIILTKNNEKIFHNKNDEKEMEIDMSIETLINLKIL